jgi:hypothetical protein
VNVNILQKESDPSAKYELFQRLNTGGSIANSQEVRNCIIVSINADLYKWMESLRKNDDFQSCIALNEKSLEEQYDMEILSRFLVLRSTSLERLKGLGDVDTFFTDRMVEIAEDPNYDLAEECRAFEITFRSLNSSMSWESFRKYNVSNQRFSGGFLLAPFETIALGIGCSYKHYTTDHTDLKEKIVGLWSDDRYLSAFGRGKDASTRLPKLIPLGRTIFGS